ncbi:MAG TPA: hypothetical protein VKJ00_10320 [Thermoanaerobaculia bacterium]|nr:hypothetical protein [Thermoanaerobaculia bacterium]
MPKRADGKKGEPDAAPVPAAFRPVAAAFARDRQVTREKGWGAGNLVLKFNGKIFVMLHNGDLVAKLPESRVDELVEKHAGTRFDPRGDGRGMKEWIVVSAGRPSWVDLAREAHGFGKAFAAAGRRPPGSRKKR